MEANKTAAACVRKFPSSCSPARPPPPRIPHNASGRPPCYLPRPDVRLDSRGHTRVPSLRPDTDLHPRLQKCGPTARLARYLPSEKMSSVLPPPTLPAPQRARLFQQFPVPRSLQDRVESETWCDIRESHP